ncbi:dihydrofolate reductase family protein [Symbioplanes lichenis]|uniref:dihydrofolate reductase family protein n=1 Tax=Symbioplanes lichenis TaxID=1629072 RepID=UPI0027388C6E|nr:dihydrofolate reductase family protein [Actinoplanes lichenis]
MGERPRVVVSVTASVDGRLALRRESLLLHAAAAREWEALMPASADRVQAARTAYLERVWGPQAVLEGSGSFVPDHAGPVDGLPPDDGQPGDFLADAVVHRPGRRKWFTVVDSRGRVRWRYKQHGDQDLLVLVAEETPREYLAYLRREGICHLVAGRERVDPGLALRRMRAELGVTCVVASGGGRLQGALLRAGLVDEVHLVVVPAVIGGSGTPALFDGVPLSANERATPLRLVASQAEPDGVLWLRYEIAESATAGRPGR